MYTYKCTVEPLNNGHVGDECFDYSEFLTCMQLLGGGTQFVHSCPLFRVSITGGSTVNTNLCISLSIDPPLLLDQLVKLSTPQQLSL